ncbi:MAG: complex I NDUFA9 subunit family protein [Calditerrivibrio sp.]|nr:complex I NDUFA9 subunit family protein [Calditerrivibrio sp.]MCA1932595.1 complex I NDUFA9 subunit family protein [Calditerrivibrio sp.]MCA1980318.1 complex I NDUFA9 subunit family protein [Calditerrivibrio sp.]
MKKVFLTGATGFVGSEILKKLIEKGYYVKALVRNRNSIKISSGNLEISEGDILNYQSVKNGVAGSDVVINLVGIIREIPYKNVTFENMHFVATKNCVDAAKELNVNRFIQMSANGTRENAVSQYHKTKYKAERYLVESGLNYTILRPSLIYGENDSFINMLNDIMKKVPIFSYFGDGSYPMQPVSVYEVAEIFVNCIEKDETIGGIYPICGDKKFTYKELLNSIMEVTGRKRVLLPVPEFFVEVGITFFGNFSWFPITKDQFTMLKEGNVCDNSDIFNVTGVEKRDFKEVLRGYLK